MATKPYPELGVPFELTLDGDAYVNQPLTMVASYGYISTGWRHSGPIVRGKETRKFMLIKKGGSWDDIGAVTGNEVEGQWLEAFKAEYPESDRNGSVGIHDKSWVGPHGRDFFPYVSQGSYPSFLWLNLDCDVFDSRWRWLVPAE